MTARFTADAADAGCRLDRVLSAHLGVSRSEAARRVVAGDVTVDGAAVDKSHRLAAGEVVAVRDPDPPATDAPAPPPVPVRHADDHLLIIAKPAGLVVHAGAGTSGPTLVDALRAAGQPLADTGDPARPGIVHRLDRGTSGLLVVALSERARAGLVAAFSRHDVDRRYWALVDGLPSPPSATVDAPIDRHPIHRTRFRVASAGRGAVTHYDVVASHRAVSEIDVRLETGRTHQVRVHLSAVGHPVSGDMVYGADRAVAAALALERPALHARRLGFSHPVTGEWLSVDEPLPDDLEQARCRAIEDRAGGLAT